ncbi:hypothetical protein F2Q69_00045814 [Brassica cretica]|uniref:Uncharacterized protein n=1 Tax=Brassica cretica TaxID=69181 RepID=A0A8S9NLQ3_BRACR|nr:hypothetical protein F2Q69_00045814 [Brassica cretica]
MQKESPSLGNKAGEACLKSNGFPEAKTQRKGIKEPIEYRRKLHLISWRREKSRSPLTETIETSILC